MTVAFIKKTDKTVTHYATYETTTREAELKIENHYLALVRQGKIYGFSIA